MKILLIVGVLAAVVPSNLGLPQGLLPSPDEEIKKIFAEHLAPALPNVIAQSMMAGFFSHLRQLKDLSALETLEDKAEVKLLIPPLPAEICLNASRLRIPIPISEDPPQSIVIGFEMLSDLQILDLDQLFDEITLGVGSGYIRVGWTMDIPSLRVLGDKALYLTSTDGNTFHLNITDALFHLKGFKAGLAIEGKFLPLDQNIVIDRLHLILDMADLTWAGNLHIYSAPADGSPSTDILPPMQYDLGPIIKQVFDNVVRPILTTIEELLTLLINNVVKDCTVLDFLSNDLSCLNINLPGIPESNKDLPQPLQLQLVTALLQHEGLGYQQCPARTTPPDEDDETTLPATEEEEPVTDPTTPEPDAGVMVKASALVPVMIATSLLSRLFY